MTLSNNFHSERDKAPKYFSRGGKPEHWVSLDFEVDGQPVPCVYIPAKNPKVQLVFGSGFNPNLFKRKALLKVLEENGVDIIATEFPRIPRGYKNNFLPRFQRENDAFFFDKDSPIFSVRNNSLPLKAFAHSARGLTMLRSFQDNYNVAFANKNYESVYVMNAMTGVSGVSKYFLLREGFNLYARAFAKYLPREAPGARHYMKWKNLKEADDNPTLGQINEMDLAAQIYMKDLKRTEGMGILRKFDLKFIIGEKDNATCPDINRNVAKILKAQTIIFENGDHTPLVLDKDAMRVFISDLLGEPIHHDIDLPDLNTKPPSDEHHIDMI